jgi:Cft2 family RNA processing exonuclease
VLIESPDAKVFVSGDFSNFDQKTVDAYGWPEEVSGADLMVLEATYGGKDHTPREQVISKFIGDVRSVVMAGGVALIACFALGRAQEVLSILADAYARGDLRGVPVYIDGMIEKVNPIYERYGRLALQPEVFSGVRGNLWEREELITRLKSSAGIVVTTSGMLQGGPVVAYAQHLLPARRNRLFLTGYQEESSLGRRVMEAAAKPGAVVHVVDQDGKQISIRLATSANVVNLSAHADRSGLIAAVTRFRPKQVVLVHGEETARAHLAAALRREGVRVAEDSRHVEL